MRPIVAFAAGLVVAVAIALSVLAADGINQAQAHRNAQVCALDKAVLKLGTAVDTILVQAGQGIPAGPKGDESRKKLALDLGLIDTANTAIQAASAC